MSQDSPEPTSQQSDKFEFIVTTNAELPPASDFFTPGRRPSLEALKAWHDAKDKAAERIAEQLKRSLEEIGVFGELEKFVRMGGTGQVLIKCTDEVAQTIKTKLGYTASRNVRGYFLKSQTDQ